MYTPEPDANGLDRGAIMRKNIFVLSIVFSVLGIYFLLTTFSPLGLLLDLIGVILLIYSIYPRMNERRVYSSETQYKKSVYEENYRCGNCWSFGNAGCPRSETLINAVPCGEFVGKWTKDR